jgi:DNA repair protein RadD
LITSQSTLGSSGFNLVELLARFDVRTLERLVEPALERRLRSVAGSVGAMSRTQWLAHCAAAAYQAGIFDRPEARKGLFQLLDDAELAHLAHTLIGASHTKAEDNALVLSKLRWAPNSSVVDYCASRFRIPYEMLPVAEAAPASVVTIEPALRLPPLHEFQAGVALDVEGVLRRGERCIVQMPTGSGKTRTCMEALAAVYGSGIPEGCIVWLAHAEELCDQAAESVARVWAERASAAIRVVRWYGRHDPPAYVIPGSVVIASLQKTYSGLRGQSPFADSLRYHTKAIVVDEAHRALAPSFQFVVEALGPGQAAVVGLTATPGRGLDKAAENRRLAAMFNGKLVSVENGEGLVDRLAAAGVLSVPHRRVIETGVEVRPTAEALMNVREGFDLDGGVLKALADNPSRNMLLLALIESEVHDNRPAIVFACTVAHARFLAAALNMRGVTAASVDSAMERASRRLATAGYREGSVDVLVNFGVLSTGFDAPRTRTVVVARPTTSAVLYGQMIGRAMRGPLMGGAAESWVIDVRDNLRRFGDAADLFESFAHFWR